jgi:small-conductance mechanosensitive channel
VVTIAPMSSLTTSTTSLRVKQINVLTTTFVQPDGKHVSMPNPQLSSMSITNLRTSGDAHLGINIKVSYGTPVEAIEALQQVGTHPPL